MRVFIAHEDIYNAGNPYIYTLMECAQKLHPDLQFGWGWNSFWSEDVFSYDAVHFHWPQAYMCPVGKEKASEVLEIRLKQLKERKIKIVSTCHDLKPHYDQCAGYDKCISLVYQYSDLIFHLGNYSFNLFRSIYSNAKNVILSHHVYDTVYLCSPSKEESARKLHLDPTLHYILCFGAFRSEEERQLVIGLARQLKNRRKEKYCILAPSFMDVKKHHRLLFRFVPTKSYLLSLYFKYFFHIFMTGKTRVPVDDELLPYYYGISDVALVQRLQILNSGNAILPLLFDKPVVGPNVGNVGEVVKAFGYPTFEVSDASHTLLPAVDSAIRLGINNYPQSIHSKVMAELSTEVVADKMYYHYSCLIG